MLLKSSHQVVVQDSLTEQWYFGLDHFADSAALVWPSECFEVPCYRNEVLFVPKLEVAYPKLLAVLDFDLVSCCVEFQSPARLARRFPLAQSELPTGVVMAQTTPSQSLFRTASQQAFWNIS
eukprot:14747598-Alexandrium_andersonii.AAC.1